MRLRAKAGVLVTLGLAIGGSSLALFGGSSDLPIIGQGDQESAGASAEVSIVERAGETFDADELADVEQRLSQLEASLGSVQAQLRAPTASSSTDSRLATLERQVGVRSIHRQTISDLWSEIAELQQAVEELESQVGGYRGLAAQVTSLQRCVDSMKRNWSSEYAPTCY
jgi:hypothetical protein